ncbi:MAG: dethiobiotin synthase [Solirubrobacterales bacterium]
MGPIAPTTVHSSLNGVLVTGTGTEVGKTVVAAVIARTLVAAAKRVAVLKPAVSGLDEYGDPPPRATTADGRWDEPDHLLLRRAAGSAQAVDEIAPYRYGPPVSPHLGAALAGEAIEPARLVSAARAAATKADALVVEGVGGFLVPLTLGYLVRDFARELGLPVVIAASPALGTINHSLLTIEAVRAVGLTVSAVVLTPWPDDPSEVERSNAEAIERLGGVAVHTLPRLDLARPDTWPALALGIEGPATRGADH